jgi:hypothetical protein
MEQMQGVYTRNARKRTSAGVSSTPKYRYHRIADFFLRLGHFFTPEGFKLFSPAEGFRPNAFFFFRPNAYAIFGGHFLVFQIDFLRAWVRSHLCCSSGRSGYGLVSPRGGASTKRGGPGRPAARATRRPVLAVRGCVSLARCGACTFWLGNFPAVRRYHTSGMCSGVTPHQGPRTRSKPGSLKDLILLPLKAVLAR